MVAALPASPPVKPLLRGWSHLVAFFFSVGFGIALVLRAPAGKPSWAAVVYVVSLCTLFGVSALYHRPTWQPGPRAVMRRLDHSAIFILIAGTFTPYALMLPSAQAKALLILGWAGAAFGCVQSIFWFDAPKPLVALPYLALGWAPVWFAPGLYRSVGPHNMALIVAGGLLYSVGALCYALKRPNFWPTVFGYHEFFHAFVIAAAVCHYLSVEGVLALTR